MRPEIEIYLRAVELAHELHTGRRYGDHAYTIHLAHVEHVLRRYHAAAQLLAAGWLHDAVEDCGATPELIAERVHPEVARLVLLVTDEPGGSRRERKAKTYPKTRTDAGAVMLKLADRIANVEAAVLHGRRIIEMYRAEQPAFESALRRPGEYSVVWAYLDCLLKA